MQWRCAKGPKTGTWWFVVDVGIGPDGKRKQARRRGFKTKDATAREELTRLHGNVDSQTYVRAG